MVRFIFILLGYLTGMPFLACAQSAQGTDSLTNNYVGLIRITDAPRFDGDVREFIRMNVRYPESARRDSIEGRVIVQFWIDSSGVTKFHRVITSVREDLDEEALRIARLIKFEKPAMQYDSVVPIIWHIPVDFFLSPENNPYVKKKMPKRRGKRIETPRTILKWTR